MMMQTIFFLLIGLAVGAAIGYLWARYSAGQAEATVTARVLSTQQALDHLRAEHALIKEELSSERHKTETIQIAHATAIKGNETLHQKLIEQKEQIIEIQTRMTKDFELLANRIFEDNSKKQGDKHETQLKQILDPLRDRLKDFEKQVGDQHLHSEKERSALKEQLRMLTDMNKRMSDEALNLTRALKGDTKKQGNWGELILEKVLEKSGLVKGREYDVQTSYTADDGSRQQPDVLVRLPDAKNIIVDSKVSLIAYDRYIATDDTDAISQAQHLADHLASIRSHIKGLSAKNYQNLYQIGSPDFVLLFVPIESAFILALSQDNELYHDAFDKNVVLVSPTTLLATLRTIANVWKQEYQNRNAQEIAKQGADLYDKFVGFTEDLIKVGKLMDDSKKVYGEAMGKLAQGKGNLVRRAETMKSLGLKTSKQLHPGLLDRGEDD
jgi:DNA recombination protein RmuC